MAALQSRIWSLLCPPADTGRDSGGRDRAAVSHNFSLFTLFLCPLSTTAKKWKRRKARGGEDRRSREALQFFLDFSCHFHDPPASERAGSRAAGRSAALSLVVSASGASSIHLERGKVDAIGDAATKEYRGRSNRLPFTAISCYTGSLLRNVIWSSV